MIHLYTRHPCVLTLAFLTLLLPAFGTQAVDPLDAPAAPSEAGSAMFDLSDLYERLNSGAVGAKRSGGFAEPASGLGDTLYSLDEIMSKMPVVDDTNGAAVGNVLAGKTFWSLTSAGWGLQTGTLAAQTPTADSVNQSAGVYEAFDLSAVDTDLAAGNIKSGVRIFGVSGDSNVVDTSSGDAVASDLLKDKVAFVDGSMVTGSMETRTLSATDETVSAGYYAATTLSAVDSDLAAGNIRAGVTLFGVSGDSNVVDTAEGSNPAVATRMKTGDVAFVNGSKITGTGTQTLNDSSTAVSEGYYASTTLSAVDTDFAAGNIKSGTDIFGVTGTYPGCDCDGGTIWNAGGGGTRWCDNGDGTVTDLLGATVDGKTKGRCLVWLKQADWGGMKPWRAASGDDDAHTRAGILQPSESGANLSDGSAAGDWRLPTRSELQALVTNPERILSGSAGPFSGVQSSGYWPSSTYASYTNNAWILSLSNGSLQLSDKTLNFYVWPVRDGQ